MRLGRKERQWLLAVDMASGLETFPGERVVGVVDCQVDDEIDRAVREELGHGRVGSAAVLRGEGNRPFRVQVGGGDQPDLRMGCQVEGIGAGDVAAADDPDAEWSCRSHRVKSYAPGGVRVYDMQEDQIAIQLYTVRDLAARDLPGTLRRVASAGFRAVEVAGLPAVEPAALRTMLDDAGLQVVAAHHALGGLPAGPRRFARRAGGDRDAAGDRSVARRRRIEDRRQPVRWPANSQPSQTRRLRVGSPWAITTMTSSSTRSTGRPPGTSSSSALPPAVEIELDVYWAAFAGRDPAALIADLGVRVRLLHMKDMAHGPDRRDAQPGDGVLAWDAIVAAARTAGVEW